MVDPRQGLEWSTDPIFSNTAFTVQFLGAGQKTDMYFTTEPSEAENNEKKFLVQPGSLQMVKDGTNLDKAKAFVSNYRIPSVKLLASAQPGSYRMCLVEYTLNGATYRGWTGCSRVQLLRNTHGKYEIPSL
eukprot:TRINITY_DN12173_c0_g1_i1.p2 TRINITY_DN12173_c0_g1~~TRINITY_DN12173_c0_g1_i1.p2  ORF type:complete len:131 (-),score=21.91 TRINITY_DN12173_c0_g1_i1:52-444(-)